VASLFGNIEDGTIVGDNLGTAIYADGHNGLIVNGAVCDVTCIREIGGFQVCTRGFDLSVLRDATPIGNNVPIWIDIKAVMAGDITLGGSEVATFVPAQLAK